MNKKILISIISIVTVTIAILATVLLRGLNDETSKLSKVYEKMVDEHTYTFTRYDFEEKNKIITCRKADKTLIDMYNSGEHSSILILEGDTYLVFHENKEYLVYSNTSEDKEILENDIKKIKDLNYTKGKEKIYGKTYKYEEYQGVSEFLIKSSRYMDTDSVKTRFYFKGNELVYLKTIYDVVNEETGERTQEEELQTIKIEYQVEDSVLKIPSDYAEI